MKCLLDLDGCLVDFVGGAARLFGKSDPYAPYEPKRERGAYETWELLGIDKAEFWRPMGEEFWAGLDWLPDGRSILSAVETTFGKESICLLTSPCLTPGCEAGKVRWIREHLPDYSRRYLIGPAKEFCAHGRAVLVDDYDVNVDRFREHGGRAVLIPRPWNSRHDFRFGEMNRMNALLTELECCLI